VETLQFYPRQFGGGSERPWREKNRGGRERGFAYTSKALRR